MRKKATALILGIIMVAAIVAKNRASITAFYGNIASEAALAFSKTYVLDLSSTSVGSLAVQTNISTVTFPAQAFNDGQAATGSITVSSFTALTAAKSVGWVKIASNTALAGAASFDTISLASNSWLGGRRAFDVITVTQTVNASSAIITLFNGTSYLTFAASAQFNLGASSAATTTNLVNALNGGSYGITASTLTNTIILVTVNSTGAAGNSYALTSSTSFAMAIKTSSFTAGADRVGISVNQTTSYANVNWAVSDFSTQTAVNLANALTGIDFGITASTTGLGTGSTVTVRISQVGSYFNTYTMLSDSAAALQVGSSSFTGGTDPATIRVNGVPFTNGRDWFTGFLASNTAQNLFLAISSNASIASVIVSSWPTSAFINFTAVSTGASTAYQYPLFTSTATAVNLSGVSTTFSGSTTTTMTGGRDTAFVIVAGFKLTQGVDWTAALSASDTAKSIDAAIKASSATNVVVSSWTTNGIVVTTAIAKGTYNNFALYTSTQSALGINTPFTFDNVSSGPARGFMTGGLNVGYSTITNIITLTSHTFTTGVAVMYSSSTGVDIAPLFNQTTYFVILNDTSSIKLSRTSTGAVAGVSIALTSIGTQTVANTFNLYPVPFAGAPTIVWQVSNDSVTWFNIAGTSFTMVTPFVSTSTVNDLGTVNYRYVRLNVIGPTAGGIRMNSVVHGKN